MLGSTLFYLGTMIGLVAVVAAIGARGRLGRRGVMGRRLTVAAAGVGVALLGLALPSRDRIAAPPRTALDRVMPRFQFAERHSIRVAASPAAVDDAIRRVSADEIRGYRALTWIRRFGRRGPAGLLDAPPAVPMLDLATRSGFRRLADVPGRDLVFGVTGPASREARHAVRAGGPRAFAPSAPGHASIAMTFHVEPDGRGGSVLSTETRVFAADAATRRRLAAYWRVILPGSALMRREWIAAIRRRAEGAPSGPHSRAPDAQVGVGDAHHMNGQR